MEIKCCGTCKWHKPVYALKDSVGDWQCSNIDSENYAYWTEYKDDCPDWEGRE